MPYVQTNRLCSLSSPLGADALLVVSMQGHEGVSEPFHFTVEVVSENADVAMEQVVGKPVSLRVQLVDGGHRFFHGIVATFEQAGRDTRLASYRLEVRPWLWLLTRRGDCRIFQHKSVPEIVREVFQNAGFEDFELRLNGNYAAREFCVQYRETDFAFVSRLLEAEGIFYFFQHEESRHVLVLCDAPSSVADCPGQGTAHYAGDLGGVEQRDEIRGWRTQRTLHPGRQALKDFNFEDPGNALLVDTKTSHAIGDNDRFEVYDHHPCGYRDSGGGKSHSDLRMEEHEASAFRIHGDGNCRAFSPGFAFTLQGHFRGDTDGHKFMLLTVTHRLTQAAGYETGPTEETGYDNVFTCVPTSAPYRPARLTPLPRITGPQTAIVVGAAGEEIDVDAYGRVWLQFHWDRQGKRDEKSSCRVRVTQAWAGNSFGFVAHPRIGDEVIVEFLEGDPDKPIVTGCVYNKRTMPPYALPGNKTQTGLKSRSTKGGSPSNFNELRFEDKKGSEEVYIQAEKNKTVLVKNDRSENVGHDESITIGHDRTEKVGHDEKITIGNDRTETVGKNETISVGVNRTETVGANESVTIGANRTENVGANETVNVAMLRTHSIGINDMLNVGAAQEVSIGGAQALSVGLARTTNVGANDSLSVGKKLTIDAGDEVIIKTGDASITMKKDGTIVIKGKDITLKGSGKIAVKADSDLTLKGSKIAEN